MRKKEIYTQVREQQGGGRIVQQVGRHSVFQEMFQRIVNVFFPSGFIKKRKHISKYKHCLGDYTLQEITKIMYPDQEVFTLEKYTESNSLKQVKFTLLTCDKKNKRNKDRLFSFNFSDDDHYDYDDFKNLPPFSFDSSTPTLPHPGKINYLKNRENSVESFNGNKIDSRSQLIEEQDEED